MTEQEIEFALQQYSLAGARNVQNMDWAGTLDYINRLKAKNKELQDKNRRVLDWKQWQEKFNNEMIDRFDEELNKQKEQIRKDTAKEIFQAIYNWGKIGFSEIKWFAKEYYSVEVDK